MNLTTTKTKELQVVKSVEVPFNGSFIEAVEYDGDIWVSVRKTCEDLGVSHQGQNEKFKTDSVLKSTVKMILTVAQDGKQREQLCINLAGYTLWLARIQENRVKEHVRPILQKYQLEAAEVLRNHFTKKPTAPNGIIQMNFDSMQSLVNNPEFFRQIAAIVEENQFVKQENKALEEEVKALSADAEAYKRYLDKNNLTDMNTMSKLVGGRWGEYKLFALLRAEGDLYFNDNGCNVPRETKQNKEYYVLKMRETDDGTKEYPVTLVKRKGEKRICKLVSKFEKLVGDSEITMQMLKVYNEDRQKFLDDYVAPEIIMKMHENGEMKRF